jgi:CDP-glucose 4,6-dehydratase
VLDHWLPRTSYLVLNGLKDKVSFIEGDIRGLDLLKHVLERFEIDTVFHIAAQPIVPMSNSIPYETLSINAMGTYAVLEALRTTSFTNKLVFASSGAYYGTTTIDRGIKEDDAPLSAMNIYAPSKVAGDIAVRCYAGVYEIKAATCRFMNTYGPGDTNFSRIIPRAIQNLIRQAPYEFGDRDDGTTKLDYMHVRDMANAYIKVAEQLDSISGEAFNFGGGNAVSVLDLTTMVSRIFDGKTREPKFFGPPKEKPLIKYLDITKSKDILEWQPTTNLEDGLRETIEWYKENWSRLEE